MTSVEVAEGSAVSVLLTIAEAARYLRISRTTLYRLTDRGEIAVVRLSHDPRFLMSDLNAFIQSKRDGVKSLAA